MSTIRMIEIERKKILEFNLKIRIRHLKKWTRLNYTPSRTLLTIKPDSQESSRKDIMS